MAGSVCLWVDEICVHMCRLVYCCPGFLGCKYVCTCVGWYSVPGLPGCKLCLEGLSAG